MMKILIAFSGLFLFIQTGFAQGKEDAWSQVEGQPVQVNELIHHFGQVKQNAKTEFKFVLENTGTEVLVIKHVTTSCGCTSPSWDKKPVKPGKKAVVRVKYDSSNPGAFTKSVFVYTNLADKPITLQIMGEVEPKERPDASTMEEQPERPVDRYESRESEPE